MNLFKRYAALCLILCLLLPMAFVSAEEEILFEMDEPSAPPIETPEPVQKPEIVVSAENGSTVLRISPETVNTITWLVFNEKTEEWDAVFEGAAFRPENTQDIRVFAAVQNPDGLVLADEITVPPYTAVAKPDNTPLPEVTPTPLPEATQTPLPEVTPTLLPLLPETDAPTFPEQEVREIGGGKSFTISITLNSKSASTRKFSWVSSDTGVATVSNGKVTAKKVTEVSECVITARLKTAPYTEIATKVIVYPAVKSVCIEAPSKTIDINADDATLPLSAACAPASSLQNVTWKSSNTKIAKVSSDGVVTPLKTGTVKITATAKDGTKKYTTVTLRVIKAVHELSLTGPAQLASGKSVKLTPAFTPADATNRKILWRSSDTNVATVSSKGVVKAKKTTVPQQVVISAISDDNRTIIAMHTITVVPIITSVSLSTKGATLYTTQPQNTLQLTAQCSPADAMQQVTWKSSNSKIATVSTCGLVTALKTGTVKITATAKDGSGKKATVVIKVEKHSSTLTRYRALVIGQEYSGSSSLGGACLRDADLIQKLLLSGSVTKYTGNNVKSISMNKLNSQIQSTFANTTDDDVCLFYYSGHGSSGGRLVGSDNTYCSPRQLRSYLDGVKGTKIVIIDACFSGANIAKTLDVATASDSFVNSFVYGFMTTEKSLYDLADSGYYVLTACSGSQLSWTGSGTYTDSLFTHYLLEGAGLYHNTGNNSSSSCTKYADSNKDGGISIIEAYNYTKKKTEEKQSAQYYASDGNTGFVFFK